MIVVSIQVVASQCKTSTDINNINIKLIIVPINYLSSMTPLIKLIISIPILIIAVLVMLIVMLNIVAIREYFIVTNKIIQIQI
jgi:hypothetical protein